MKNDVLKYWQIPFLAIRCGIFLVFMQKNVHKFVNNKIKLYLCAEKCEFTRTIDLMKNLSNVMCLAQYGGLHYEALHGDKEGLSSVKVNDQYRIEFREIIKGDKTIAEVVSITELSNHYK